jgi:hypothetical protein
MRFERRNEPILPWAAFFWRMAGSTVIGAGLVVCSLAIGMIGYRRAMGLSWIDAFLNASMILSGMGPLADPQTSGAKLFAGLYALFSGLAVLAIAGVVFAPAIHRFLHYLHADLHADADDEQPPRPRRTKR